MIFPLYFWAESFVNKKLYFCNRKWHFWYVFIKQKLLRIEFYIGNYISKIEFHTFEKYDPPYCSIIELLKCWSVEVLKFWSVERVNCWFVEWLNCWIVELLNCWSFEVLKCWSVDLLICWIFELLNCWCVEWLNCWIVEL